MTELLVSVVIRTCPGRISLLKRTVQSVKAQRYRPIELVIVEDGGTSVATHLHELKASTDVPILYIPLEKVGRCEAGNAGLSSATGTFLNFLDDDDEFLPHHLSLLVAALQNCPEAGAAYASSFLVKSDIVSLDPLIIEEHRRELFGRFKFDIVKLWEYNQFPIQSVLFRRQLFERLGGLSAELDALEDWDLWLRYSAESDFVFVDVPTSRFRVPSSAEELERRRQVHLSYLDTLRSRQHALYARYRNTIFERRLAAAFATSLI